MLTHRGFSAWIVVDGEPLPEYLVAVDTSNNRVSCWIPSEEGKAFTVYWHDHGGNVATCGYITLDGYLAPGRFLHGDGTAWRAGVRTGPASERPFLFQRAEESGPASAPATCKDAGTIILRIKRVKFVASAAANPFQQLPQPHSGRNGMRIGFGAEQPAYEQYPSTWKVEPYDNPGQNKPSTYVTFVFRYRDPDFLRTQGIIEDAAPVVPIQRLAQRRAVSMPSPVPSPSNPPSNPQPDSVYYRLGSQRSHRSDSKRSISLNVAGQVDEIEERPINYPGEGLIIFPPQRPMEDTHPPKSR